MAQRKSCFCLKKVAEAFVLSTSLTAFVACGGDFGSSDKDADVYGTTEDLPHCGKSREGEKAFVESDSAYYECQSGEWVKVDEEDSTGSKSENDTAVVERVKIDSATVQGFAQKGPFASGASVTLYGLDSSLAETKTKFTGKVSGDSGFYSVAAVALDNQYALLTANGYFKNAVTGKTTSGTKIKLSALVDLTDTSDGNAWGNVNVFSEWELSRVRHLVSEEKFNVPSAKRRAMQELLSAFGMGYSGESKVDSLLVSTHLSLADTGFAGAALLAAGVMVTADLNPAKVSSRISGISSDFAEDGKWDDTKTRAAVADFLASEDSADGYAGIRANVKAYKLSEQVPGFESILRAFWTAEFGLPECTDDLEEQVEKNAAEESGSYGSGYVCTSGRWHRVSALDALLGLCTASKEGAFETVDSAGEYYKCESGVWRKISETEYNLKECTEKREGEYANPSDGEYFVCSEKQWRKIDVVTYELKLCTEKRSGEYAETKAGGYYKCAGEEWTEVSELDYALKNCTEAREGEALAVGGEYYLCKDGSWMTIDSLSYQFGICDSAKTGTLEEDEKDNTKRYVCENDAWRLLSETESELGLCTESLEGAVKESMTGEYFGCTGGKWTLSDEVAFNLGALCSAALEDSVKWFGNSFVDSTGIFTENIPDTVGVSFYECHDGAWEASTGIRWLYGANCSDGAMNSIYSQAVLEKEGYTLDTSSALKAILTILYYISYNSYFIVDGGDTLAYAVCKNDKWEEISDADYNLGKICPDDVAVGTQNDGYQCESDGWRKMSSAELNLGACSASLWGTISDGYVCDSSGGSYAWRSATWAEKKTGALCSDLNRQTLKNGYVCDTSGYRAATTAEAAAGAVCTKSIYSTLSGGYVCDSASRYDGYRIYYFAWREATDNEKRLNAACADSGNAILLNDSLFVCFRLSFSTGNRDWRPFGVTTIGSQTWMAEDYREYRCDLDSCWQYYNEWKHYDATSVCPNGWHLPDLTEWENLKSYVESNNGGEGVGTSLKSPGWHAYSGVADGTDKFGFAAKGPYSDVYWTKTIVEVKYANSAYLTYSSNSLSLLSSTLRTESHQVRCVKDSD